MEIITQNPSAMTRKTTMTMTRTNRTLHRKKLKRIEKNYIPAMMRPVNRSMMQDLWNQRYPKTNPHQPHHNHHSLP
jgi:hypothetical protein